MQRPIRTTTLSAQAQPDARYHGSAIARLVDVVQELSHARSMDEIVAITRDAARFLTGADGASFVLRDKDDCLYVDENAISPLWKGKRFPLSQCVSGWVMLNAKSAMIEDIYNDPRVPVDAYRPTFVKSLAMVPIRRSNPIGAIGNYWAKNHKPTDEQMDLLQALADTTSVAIENVQLYTELNEKVRALQETNYELSRFAWVASHDLQEPLRTVSTQIGLLERRYGAQLDARARSYVQTALDSAERLQALIEALLVHARAEKVADFTPVDLGRVCAAALSDIRVAIDESRAQVSVGELPEVMGDAALLGRVLQNLLTNALKFRPPGEMLRIDISAERKDKEWVVAVCDNGIGIEPAYQERIFGLFQRLHSKEQYPGSGIGLATCRKILALHGGRIWVESAPGEGSAFRFTLPAHEANG